MNEKPLKQYRWGRAFAISGIACTTIALFIFFLGGAPFYYAILFLMGIVFGFIGAFFLFLSMRKSDTNN